MITLQEYGEYPRASLEQKQITSEGSSILPSNFAKALPDIFN